MRCTHCEMCCRGTRMELCEADIVRLERAGHRRREFADLGTDGLRRLRNRDEFCYFYDRDERRCSEYARRPLGCVLYPVNLSSDGQVIVDELCPQADTVTVDEMERNGRRLRRLVETIASERIRSHSAD